MVESSAGENGQEQPDTGWTEEHTQRVIQQALELWIQPEIARRQELGSIPRPFELRAAQVIFDPDAEAVEVRLNDEVQIVGQFPAEGPLKKGDIIEVSLETISGLMLTDQDPNAGHLTIHAAGGKWLLAFDFRRNAARIAKHLEVAREFLDAASFSLNHQQFHAFHEALFSAVESMAKSVLLMLPGREIIESKKHSTIARRFNWWGGKLGNIDRRFVELLNTLSDDRAEARYLRGDWAPNSDQAAAMLATAEEMYEVVKEQVPTRYGMSGEEDDGDD